MTATNVEFNDFRGLYILRLVGGAIGNESARSTHTQIHMGVRL